MNPEQNNGGFQPQAPADPNTVPPPQPVAPAPYPAQPVAPQVPVNPMPQNPPVQQAAPQFAAPQQQTSMPAPQPTTQQYAPQPIPRQGYAQQQYQQPQQLTATPRKNSKLLIIIGAVVGFVIVLAVLLLVVLGGGDALSSTTRISYEGASMLVPESYVLADDSGGFLYSTDDSVENNTVVVGLGVASTPSGFIEAARKEYGSEPDTIIALFEERLGPQFGTAAEEAVITVVEYTNDRLTFDVQFSGENNFFTTDASVWIRYTILDTGKVGFSIFGHTSDQNLDTAAIEAMIQSLEVE